MSDKELIELESLLETVNVFDDAEWVQKHGNDIKHHRKVLEDIEEADKDDLLRGYWTLLQELLSTDTEDFSDGYHTFKELYDFRKVYNAALFNEWAHNHKYEVHKSTRHHDGALCFGGGWFIVSARLPAGIISNHYDVKDWELFRVPAVDKSLFEYDGHTSEDVLKRMNHLLTGQSNNWE